MKISSVLVLVALACNQQVYDAIYYGIMQEAIKGNITRQALMQRYDTIQNLRALCNGQKSSWETQSDTEKHIGAKEIK